jgi:hydrogenase large subunit
MSFEWRPPRWCNAIERDRARIYYVAYWAAQALYFLEKGLEEVRQGHTKTFTNFDVPDESIGCGFHEAVRGCYRTTS